MPKYINADEMFADESEAYMRAQTKITDEATYIVNHVVHMKVQRLLYDAPAADVAPVVHGRWVPTESPFINDCENCSVCGYKTVWGHRFNFNYCPNCGARMDGGDDGETD